MRRNAFLPVLAALLSSFGLAFAEAPSGLQLFLLIGQSNMAGRGIVTPADQQTNPRIFMLDKANAWVPAKDPVHFDKPKVAGVGLCSEFARCVAANEPDAKIGLIPCAFGGTTLDQWKPGSTLYTNAVARTRIALKSGRLAGILWHQGEGDCAEKNRATYPARFAAMIDRLRQDLDAKDVPVIVGELGASYHPGYAPFNAMLPQVTNAVPYSALVSSEGLGSNPDKVHFSADALRVFGKRYATAFQNLKKDGVPR
ncbi:MAG TPA: sialate O-acetylesterase [Kiritimatiellia bacterium]|nr:sialate O-acetylesterase [Kiritimatiellia bacterium]HPS06412.1 sialate O-acetylesterase [Kiritimatiellia bacterium]